MRRRRRAPSPPRSAATRAARTPSPRARPGRGRRWDGPARGAASGAGGARRSAFAPCRRASASPKAGAAPPFGNTGSTHVVELLHPPATLVGVPGLRGPRELYDLRATSRIQHRRGIGREPPVGLQPTLDEFRQRDLGRGMLAHIQILALEVLPRSLVAKADEHLVLIAEQRRGGEVRRGRSARTARPRGPSESRNILACET